MARKTYGPISKPVKELCVRLCLMNGSEAEFKDGLRKLVHTDASFHAIGTSLQKWAVEFSKDDIDRVWRLADQVDTKIRKAWLKYRGDFLIANAKVKTLKNDTGESSLSSI